LRTALPEHCFSTFFHAPQGSVGQARPTGAAPASPCAHPSCRRASARARQLRTGPAVVRSKELNRQPGHSGLYYPHCTRRWRLRRRCPAACADPPHMAAPLASRAAIAFSWLAALPCRRLGRARARRARPPTHAASAARLPRPARSTRARAREPSAAAATPAAGCQNAVGPARQRSQHGGAVGCFLARGPLPLLSATVRCGSGAGRGPCGCHIAPC
jgi:hypothetical protein